MKYFLGRDFTSFRDEWRVRQEEREKWKTGKEWGKGPREKEEIVRGGKED